jgi:hypothetical protein
MGGASGTIVTPSKDMPATTIAKLVDPKYLLQIDTAYNTSGDFTINQAFPSCNADFGSVKLARANLRPDLVLSRET